MPSLMRWAALICMVLAAPACTLVRGQSGEDSTDARVTVVVENQNVLDVSIIAVNGEQLHRLGTVRTGATETFELSGSRLFVNLRLQADPLGNLESFETSAISVTPGRQVALTVASNLSSSNYVVR